MKTQIGQEEIAERRGDVVGLFHYVAQRNPHRARQAIDYIRQAADTDDERALADELERELAARTLPPAA